MSTEIFPHIDFDADATETRKVPGGEYAVHISGTWDGGTMTVQSWNGATAVPLPDGAYTADGGNIHAIGSGYIRFVLSGSTSPDLKVTFEKVS